MPVKTSVKTIGILGFGAFGNLIAEHLCAHFELVVCDPALTEDSYVPERVQIGDVAEVGRCDLVILALPIEALAASIKELRAYLQPGCIVADVVSVKIKPVEIMRDLLPPFVEIIGTHPLFGPQSARNGIAGRKISLCPVRGNSASRVAAFLRLVLGLKVYITTPEEHDKEAAIVQGITHLVAKVLVRMEPLPTRLTTASFEKLMQATDMVRDDAANVFLAIERDNPFSAEMRERFFEIANQIKGELEGH